MNRTTLTLTAAALMSAVGTTHAGEVLAARHEHSAQESAESRLDADRPVYRRSVEIDGVNVFYRESGPGDAPDAGGRERPVVVLLHGFPTSSHMFRNLIPELSREYRVIAPDWTGWGIRRSPLPSAQDIGTK